MSNRYSLYPITMKYGGGPTVWDLRQLDRYSVQKNANKSIYIPGGALDVQHVGLANASPLVQLGTRDLTGVLGHLTATTGLELAGDTTGGSVLARYQQRKCQDSFDTTAVHIGETCKKGFIKINSIGASENDLDGAMVLLDLYPVSLDGFEEPIVKVGSVDLSAVVTPLFNSRFFFGPIFKGANQLEGIEGWSLETGLNCVAKIFDGVFPICYTIDTRTPKLTFTGTDAAIDAAASMFIRDVDENIVAYLRKGAHAQSRVDRTTGAHFSATIASGEWCVEDENTTENEDGSFSFSVTPTGTIATSITATIPAT